MFGNNLALIGYFFGPPLKKIDREGRRECGMFVSEKFN